MNPIRNHRFASHLATGAVIGTVLVAGTILTTSVCGIAQLRGADAPPVEATKPEASDLDRAYQELADSRLKTTLPPLKHLSVEKLNIPVTEAAVDKAVGNLLRQNGFTSVDTAFLDSLGFKTVQELRSALRDMMENAIHYDVQESLRGQVKKYLLAQSQIDVSPEFLRQHADVAMGRQTLDLLLNGISADQIEAKLREGDAKFDAQNVRELKQYFILRAVADARGIEAKEADIDKAIVASGVRFSYKSETMKKELVKKGMISAMAVRVREQMSIDSILRDAIEETK